jgi:hypothetical protein
MQLIYVYLSVLHALFDDALRNFFGFAGKILEIYSFWT